MSVQASVAVIEASTHADFLNVKPNKQSVQQENKLPRETALLPGRIFQLEKIGKIQFRRAIDKL
jgi:hypothetical protein